MDRTDAITNDYIVSWWEKDGMWHYALPCAPTEYDRKHFPVSYPLNDDGPFFRWTAHSFHTKTEAIQAARGRHR